MNKTDLWLKIFIMTIITVMLSSMIYAVSSTDDTTTADNSISSADDTTTADHTINSQHDDVTSAKKDWSNAKSKTILAREEYNIATLEFKINNSPEHEKAVIEKGKALLNAALDEANYWLIWKGLEAEYTPELPSEIKASIKDDVDKNQATIKLLKKEVENINTRFDLGVVFLKITGKYFELISDVARNSGYTWVHVANTYADKIEKYESVLRTEAYKFDNNEKIIEKLDLAKTDLSEARQNIDKANSAYDNVKIAGTPLIKFSEGNNYLRVARANMLSSSSNLNQAFVMMTTRSD